jgi:hypothetical protein
MFLKSTAFPLILAFVALFCFACQTGDEDDGVRPYYPGADDSDDDLSPSDDDDADDDADDDIDDDADDDIDDDTSWEFPNYLIESPLDGAIYYSSRILLTLDETIIHENGQVFLDDELVPWGRIHWLEIDEGAHTIDLFIDDELIESIEFEKRSAEAANFANEDIDSFPTTVQLPEADGALVPVRFRLENTGDRTCSLINLRTPDQPDFTSVQSLRQWIEAETVDLSPRETVLYLFNFVGHWLRFSAPLLDGADDYWRSSVVLDVFHGWGLGFCSNYAEVFVSLVQMLGWDLEETRTNSLEGHVTAEIKYDGAWHHFDVSSHTYYWDDEGRILPLSEIEGDNASLILDYMDQFGYSLGGSWLEVYVSAYENDANNTNYNYEAIFGDDRGFVLDTGDVLELYPFGFGLFLCDGCEWSPMFTPTGVLRRTLDNPVGSSMQIHEPYPLLGLILQAEVAEQTEVSITLFVSGSNSEKTEHIDISFSPGQPIDLSVYMDYKLVGEIHDLRIDFTESSIDLDQVIVETLFQYASFLTPQITHDQRQLIVSGDCGALNLQLEVHDIVTTISGVQFFTSADGGVPDIKNNGKALVALGINAMTDEDEWASGHHIEVVSDHADLIEIIESTANVDSLSMEPIFSDWLGPNRISGDKIHDYFWDPRVSHQRIYWARSLGDTGEDIGLVTFSLLIDGEQRAQTQVNFIAE